MTYKREKGQNHPHGRSSVNYTKYKFKDMFYDDLSA